MTLRKTDLIDVQPGKKLNEDIIVATDDRREVIVRMQMIKGRKLRKLAPNVFTTNMDVSPEVIVKRNLLVILGHMFPGAVLSHRSAYEMNPGETADVYLTFRYTKIVPLPGVLVHVLKGEGKLDADTMLEEGLAVSSAGRMILENFQRGRVHKGESKTLGREKTVQILRDVISEMDDKKLASFMDGVEDIAMKTGMEEELQCVREIVYERPERRMCV